MSFQPVFPTYLWRRWLWGVHSWVVLLTGAIALLLDQWSKYELLSAAHFSTGFKREITPFLDIVLVWNRGISFGLFQQNNAAGLWFLIVLALLASVIFWVLAVRACHRGQSLAIGLIIAGALGNGIDRLIHGAVVDFFYFHYADFSWFVFNLADMWIVCGALLSVFFNISDAARGRTNS